MAKRRQIPARTPEARENQLINLAVNEVEKRLKDGSISSQLLAILLKLATTRAQLELEKIRSDIALQKAKEEEIKKKESDSDLYNEALNAFRSYNGSNSEYDEEYEDEYL